MIFPMIKGKYAGCQGLCALALRAASAAERKWHHGGQKENERRFRLRCNLSRSGERIALLRKQKGWSQGQLAKVVGASREAIGKYERSEASPSIETAKKIADALEVTLDYLVDESALPAFDKKTVNRLKSIQQLGQDEQAHIFAMLDAFLRDAKTRQAYAS